jgi:hypothetical protein
VVVVAVRDHERVEPRDALRAQPRQHEPRARVARRAHRRPRVVEERAVGDLDDGGRPLPDVEAR